MRKGEQMEKSKQTSQWMHLELYSRQGIKSTGKYTKTNIEGVV